MKFINRGAHAVLDYMVGIVLVAAPRLLGFSGNDAARWSAVAVGVVTVGMSLITDYEGGVIKMLPMGAHLTLDVVTGIFLSASPWLLRFSNHVFWPHLMVGLLEIVVVICTRNSPRRASPDGDGRPHFWYR